MENLQPIHIAKNEKACSEENTKAMAEQPSGRIRDSVGHLNRNQAERWDYTTDTASLK